MSQDEHTQWGLREVLKRNRAAAIGLAATVVVAFLLGGFFLGGSAPATTGDEVAQTASANADSGPTLWTCSMHPQIQLPHPGKCPICFMDLIPVTTGGGEDLGPRQLRMSETAKQLAQIETSPVVRSVAERQIRMVGKLDYDETRVAYITAWVPGRLDKLYVDFTGATVSKGQPMVGIYSPELVAAQEELQQAEDAVKTLDGSGSSVLRSTADETARAASEKLRLLGLTEQQIADIGDSHSPSDFLTINAPIGGVVVHKDAKEGMYVTTGTKIYTIADLSKLWVQLEAYESDLPWVKTGQEVELTSPSFPGQTFTATIDFIDPVVDPAKRTAKVRAKLSNRDGLLKPEMFVTGTIHAELATAKGSSSGSLMIPATAPLLTGKRAVVYIEIPNDEGPLFEGREVELGPRAGDYYVVKSGLEEGDQVVTNGAFKIDSELQIQAKPSMMSPKSEAVMASQPKAEVSKAVATTTKAKTETTTNELMPASPQALQALNPLYDAYFKVQMALASDDLAGATAANVKLAEAIKSVDMELFEGKSHMRWMQISKSLDSAAVEGAKAKSLTEARDDFYCLSQAAIELQDTFGHAESEDYYLTFCPMARDNAGAFWLQTVDTVYNSFYGPAMLRCGEIKKPLPASSSEPQSSTQGSGDQLTSLYHAYFKLQRSLTFDNVDEIRSDYRGLAGDAAEWQEGDSEGSALANLAEQGAEASDISSARNSFLPVAEKVIELHKQFGHSEDKNYYLIYCPHATDSGGASWLQDVDTMYNSFLGGVMAGCSEEKQVLPPRKGEGR